MNRFIDKPARYVQWIVKKVHITRGSTARFWSCTKEIRANRGIFTAVFTANSTR